VVSETLPLTSELLVSVVTVSSEAFVILDSYSGIIEIPTLRTVSSAILKPFEGASSANE